MKCPACKETSLVMADRKGVEIDYCPDCRGVWLDRGELDKIIERSAAYDAPTAQSTVSQEPSVRNKQVNTSDHGSSKYNKKQHKDGRKKNRMTDLLGDIFDF